MAINHRPNASKGTKRPVAGTTYEKQARKSGHTHIAGVDEAGRGPLAGPVCAAAVILDPKNIPKGLADSKTLTAQQRAALFEQIVQRAFAVSISLAPAEEIDRINIRQATLLSMTRAVEALALRADFVLIDGRDIPPALTTPAQAIIKGDSKSVSVAAASIVAKVTRDRLMTRLGEEYPSYGFERHMGYPTKAHRDALRRHGPTPFHRRSFAPLKSQK